MHTFAAEHPSIHFAAAVVTTHVLPSLFTRPFPIYHSHSRSRKNKTLQKTKWKFIDLVSVHKFWLAKMLNIGHDTFAAGIKLFFFIISLVRLLIATCISWIHFEYRQNIQIWPWIILEAKCGSTKNKLRSDVQNCMSDLGWERDVWNRSKCSESERIQKM